MELMSVYMIRFLAMIPKKSIVLVISTNSFGPGTHETSGVLNGVHEGDAYIKVYGGGLCTIPGCRIVGVKILEVPM